MALPSSGSISLNQIHVEAGDTSGTTCSLNDSNIRALIGKASGAQMSFNDFYEHTVTRTITAGWISTYIGYWPPWVGSIDNADFSDQTILYAVYDYSTNMFLLWLDGDQTNTAPFKSITPEGGATLTRANAGQTFLNGVTGYSWSNQTLPTEWDIRGASGKTPTLTIKYS